MYKLFLILGLAVITFSCSVQEEVDNFKPKTINQSAYNRSRTIDEAITIAIDAVSDNNISRSNYGVDKNKVVVLSSRQNSRGLSDSLIYAVNFENDGGYVLVSVPTNVSPVLAVVENGSISESYNDEELEWLIDMTKDFVKNEMSTNGIIGVQPNPQPYDQWQFLNIKKGPNIETCWGQGWPAGMYCPNYIAGCVPLAITEIWKIKRFLS